MNRDAQGYRTVRLRTLLVSAAGSLALVIVLTLWNWQSLSQQIRALRFGNRELAAEKYGWKLGQAADSVEIFEIDESGKGTNSVRIYSSNIAVVAGRNLAGAEAKAFLERWGDMTFDWKIGGMCHEPAFVVRFLKNGKPLLETTLCFMCQNFTTPLGYMGFDQNSHFGQQFVAQVRGLFPDSPKWVAFDEMENHRRERQRRHDETIGNPPLR